MTVPNNIYPEFAFKLDELFGLRVGWNFLHQILPMIVVKLYDLFSVYTRCSWSLTFVKGSYEIRPVSTKVSRFCLMQFRPLENIAPEEMVFLYSQCCLSCLHKHLDELIKWSRKVTGE